MTHPTEDELERMTREQEYQAYIAEMTPNGNNRITNATLCAGPEDRQQRHIATQINLAFQAGWEAAMLRACKSGAVRVDTHTVANEVFKAIVWGAQQPPPTHGAAYPSYTRYGNSDAETEARIISARILSALEPAPDERKEGWRAGIEAAAQVADRRAEVCDDAWKKTKDPSERCAAIEARHIARTIRALAEKGPDHE